MHYGISIYDTHDIFWLISLISSNIGYQHLENGNRCGGDWSQTASEGERRPHVADMGEKIVP